VARRSTRWRRYEQARADPVILDLLARGRREEAEEHCRTWHRLSGTDSRLVLVELTDLHAVPGEDDPDVLRRVHEQRLLEAIKTLEEDTGRIILEAREAVKAIQRRPG
jgi:hypothetical protein